MITLNQIKAARALLGWSQMTLALESDLASTTIGSLERGKKSPSDLTLATIQRAFEKAGVEFTNGGQPGVRLKGKAAFDENENIKSPNGLGDAEVG